MRSIYTFLLFCFLLNSVGGQVTSIQNKIGEEHRGASLKSLLQAAEKASSQSDYYAAYKYYELALEQDTTAETLQKYADAAFAIHANDQAESGWLILLERFPEASANTDNLLRLADVYYGKGDYEKASNTYKGFIANSANTDMALLKRAEQGLEQSKWAMEMQSESDADMIVERLNNDVNTPYSEFAPMQQGESFYFSSLRFPYEKDKNYPERHLTKVMVKESKNGSSMVNQANYNTPDLHTAHTAFSKDGNSMYFTNCSYVNKTEIQCKLYVRQKSSTGVWGDAVALPESINMSGYTFTEPNVGRNTTNNREVLYFASDRPGSKGKRDIWYVELLGGQNYSVPVNLSSINTEKDDITPFYDYATAKLYFSSNGHKTLGGYDVFSATAVGDTWSNIEHLPSPVNTASNDIYYTVSDNNMEAYLASNRPGSLYLDSVSCCYDIYRVDLFKPVMKAISFHGVTKDSLSGVTMSLVELSGSNEEIKIDVTGVQTDFPIRMSKSYMLIGSKAGYSSDTIYFQTSDKPWKGYLIEKLNLQPRQVNLIAYTFDAITKEPLVGTTCEFQDLGMVMKSGEIATAKSLEGLRRSSDVNMTANRFDYGLEFEHRYKVLVRKDGYTIDSAFVTTEGMVGSQTIEKKLYLYRGGGIQLIALVFDARSKEPLIGTTCEFQDLGMVLKSGTTGSGMSLEGLRRSSDVNMTANRYDYGLEFEHRYKVLVRKDGYTIDSAFVTTEGMVSGQTIEKKLYLYKGGVQLITYAFDGYTKEPLVGTNIKFYEVSGTRNEANSNVVSNDYNFGLDFERSYWVVISKSGYTSDSVLVTTRNISTFDFHELKRSLYLYPATPPLAMPLVLYFDNDEPDKRVVRTTTIKTYGETYDAYYKRKPDFVRIHDLEGGYTPGSMEEGRMVHFFEADVKGGWEKLKLFSEFILKDLESGNMVEIEVSGFASPRAKTDYNEKLTARRISSIKNHFSSYKQGVFLSYLKTGKLVYVETPKGEITAPAGISDVLEDQKNSVYSISASKERRVELKSRTIMKN